MITDTLPVASSGNCKSEESDDEDDDTKQEISSLLPLAIQTLVKTLFDTNSLIQTTMAEFQLNEREKYQSARNIILALEILSRITDQIEYENDREYFDSHSKEFFKLVPCNASTTIDTLVKVERYRKLVESLKNIEATYLQVKHETKIELDPVDRLYEGLDCDISIVDHETDEFSIIKQYLENTTCNFKGNQSLTIDELFKIKRHGEEKRNEPFKHLHNRQLLWHGSQLTNFVGILKYGLKVAPPEAKHTGHAYGKGIYFADMAQKSAFYSYINTKGVSGFMVLCEVALGEMEAASYARLPSAGKNSFKAAGSIAPLETYVREDGVVIPLGVPNNIVGENDNFRCIPFNEYIVFDPAQVSVQYLVKVKGM